MRRELLRNNSADTLDGGINNSVTSIDVASGSVFPSTGDFRLLIESEILLCTARSGNALTVVRGVEGTSAASHADTSTVTHILTTAALEQYGRDSVPNYNAAPPLRIFKPDGSIAVVSDLTWVNQGTSTATDSSGSIVLKGQPSTGDNIRALVQTAPSTPYSMTLAFEPFHVQPDGSTTFQSCGAYFRESGTGKLIFLSLQPRSGGSDRLSVYRFTNTTTFSAEPANRNHAMSHDLVWFKLEDDGTNLKFHVSPNGIDWQQFYSESRTTFMAGGPDQVGFGVNPGNDNSVPVWMIVHHVSF